MRAWIKYTLILAVFILGVIAGRFTYTGEVQAQSGQPCINCTFEEDTNQFKIDIVFAANTFGYTIGERTLNHPSPTTTHIELRLVK